MFKKIVANLPFNPTMITALGFYSDRLKQERGIRRLSFVFIALTMVMQVLVVASPPQRSLAASSNHIISNVTSRDQILSQWDSPTSDVRAIYEKFQVTRADIAALSAGPNVTIKSSTTDYWTIGRNSIRSRSDIKQVYRDNEKALEYSPGKFIYNRQLRAWDIKNPSNSYPAFQGTISATGQTFWILQNCGNLTLNTPWQPPAPDPGLEIHKAVTSSDTVEPGNTLTYQIKYRNPVPDTTHKNIVIKDRLDLSKATVTTPGLNIDSTGLLTYNVGDLPYSVEFKKLNINLKISQNIKTGDKICNVARITNEVDDKADSNTVCVTGYNEPPPPDDPPPPPPPEINPEIVIQKSIQNHPVSVEQGDTLTYKIEYRNSVPDSLAKNVTIEDDLDTDKFDVISPSDLNITNGVLVYEVGSLSYTPDFRTLSITVRLKDQLPSRTEICNPATIKATNATTNNATPACVTVINKCPIDVAINLENSDCAQPVLECELVDATVNLTSRKVTFKTSVDSSNVRYTEIKRYVYDFGDDKEASFDSNELTHSTMHTYAPGDYEAKVTVFFQTKNQDEDNDQSVDCTAPISFEKDKPLGKDKTVANITQDKKGSDAKDSKVNAGDVLEYTLTTTNSQKYDRNNITISDDINDVLDYADIDLAFLKEQGGTYDKRNKTIVFDDVTVPAESSIEHVFRVTLKNPIPTTNSVELSGTHDCEITNEYGSAVSIKINCPLVKGLESLPNTGPGTSLAAMTGITMVVGYFFSRSRLLAKEVDFVRQDYVATGGM